MVDPLVFNIQNYSLNDGPGIRTIVFLKGCPMRCRWCCNPESQEYNIEMSYRRKNCIGEKECGFCKQSCHQKAIFFDEEGKAKIERSLCTDCLSCTKVCPAMAMKQQGKPMEISEIIDQVLRPELLSSWRRRTYRQRWGTSFSWRLADQTVKRSEKTPASYSN